MPTYRTPDVYVEEISVFPPSVAEVATAVPAFIGYTAKATRDVEGDLKNVPTRVTSLLEFEQLFGGVPTLDVSKVLLDDAGNFLRAELGTGVNFGPVVLRRDSISIRGDQTSWSMVDQLGVFNGVLLLQSSGSRADDSKMVAFSEVPNYVALFALLEELGHRPSALTRP